MEIQNIKSMPINKLKQDLKNLAIRQLKEAIEKLISTINSSSPIHNDALNLLSQYNQMKRSEITRTVSDEQLNLRFNQIMDGFLNLVNQLEASDLAQNEVSATNSLVTDLEALEQKGLRRQAELLIRKLNKLNEALLLSTDASEQFKYEEQIKDLENQLKKLKGD